ncbi:MAG: MotA/TolQ/ExbB proton channel family protein [Cyanobacteriota bacterium]|jgi:biopolymer transport protein ExbB/TolQ
MSTYPFFAQTERQEMSVSMGTTFLGSAGLTALLYGLAYPLRKTPLGIQMFERGFTQILVVFLGIFIAFYLSFRLLKIRREFKHLNQEIIPANIFNISPAHPGLNNLQQALIQEKSLFSRRCSRVIGAYQQAQTRRAAAEFAQEDALFYQQMMASAYALPRILLWSIPLLGLMGTLFGLGAAVQGFSRFLEQAANLEQVQTGFGSVAAGLAVAFDSTLAALFFSIAGMVFLSLVERQENQLLLLIDIYIADKILPRLQEPELEPSQSHWRDSLEEVVQELLPRRPVPRAVGSEANESLVLEVRTVQKNLVALLEGIYQNHQDWQHQSQLASQRLETILCELSQQIQGIASPALSAASPQGGSLEPLLELARDFHQEFLGGIARVEALYQNQSLQIQASQDQSARALRETVERLSQHYQALHQGLAVYQQQLEQTRQLLQAAPQTLGQSFQDYGQRLEALALALERQNQPWTTALRELQTLLERLDEASPESERLTAVLGDIERTLTALRPSLDRLNAPRRLVMFEQEDPSHETRPL